MERTAGRKFKYDYNSDELLAKVADLAKKGMTDKEIALSLGIRPETFCIKKRDASKLSQVLESARATITAAVRAKFLAMAIGGIKTKNITRRKLKDEEGKYTGEEEVMTTENELAPSLQAMSVWLFHHDKQWRDIEMKKDEESDVPTNVEKGVDIDSWIRKEIE